MILELLRLGIDVTDEDFNAIYPENIITLAQKHWTPMPVAKLASEFLTARSGAKVLDIGSGAGKFCLIGAASTRGHFTGIEHRGSLVELSRSLSKSHGVHNAKFIHVNITTVPFKDYNAFYFYNAFFENIDRKHKIDDTVELDAIYYHKYSTYVTEQFSALPVGALIATYCSSMGIVPSSFRLIDSLYDGKLNLWEKVF